MNRSDIGCVTFAENIVFHLASSVCRRLAECHHYAKCVVYACVCEMRKKLIENIRPKNGVIHLRIEIVFVNEYDADAGDACNQIPE